MSKRHTRQFTGVHISRWAAKVLALICALSATAWAKASPTRRDSGQIITLIATEASQAAPKICGDGLTVVGDGQGKTKCGVLLKFDLKSIPENATIVQADLILFAANTPSGSAPASHTVEKISPGGAADVLNIKKDASFGEMTPDPTGLKKRGGQAWNAIQKFSSSLRDRQSPLWLRVTTESAVEGYKWHSLTAKSDQRPRLVLEYTTPGGTVVSQTDGVSWAHSHRPFLPRRNDSVSAGFSYTTFGFPNAYSYAPVFFSNWVYMLTEKTLVASDSLGNQVASMSLPAGSPAPGQHLLVGKDGRLFIVGNGRLLVYQLPGDRPLPENASPLHDETNDNLKPGLTPTLGPDGTLYFVNGMEAYALNPDLSELWHVTLGSLGVSRMTLGPSGRFVYLVSQADGLVAIQAQTGRDARFALANQEKLSKAEKTSLQAPIVLVHPDGTEKVYVAANSANAGTLGCFDFPGAIGMRYFEKPDRKECWDEPASGLWGQPIADLAPVALNDGRANENKSIYAVQVSEGRGQLMAINWLSGKSVPKRESFAVSKAGSAPFVLNGGNIATDAEGNAFVWNTEGLLITSETLRFLVPLPAIPSEAQLLFGPASGTLYLNRVDSRILTAIVPSYTLNSRDESKPETLSSPTHLRVDGKAGGRSVLHADHTVILGNGFTVPNGTILHATTGVPIP